MEDRLKQLTGESRTRRTVLAGLGAAGAMAAAPAWLSAQDTAVPALLEITVHPADVLADVSPTFTGLSYEAAQLMYPGFFAGNNSDLVALFQTLRPQGVLRIGGNTSAFTIWQPGTPANGGVSKAGYSPDRGVQASKQMPGMYPITPLAIDNLRAFLDKTGWVLLYGLNLRNSTPEAAADEAAYVERVCGPKLLGLQFGNEPDLFRHDDGGGKDGRGSLWNYDEFLARWKAMYAAVHARVPAVPIEGPDSAAKEEYGGKFAADTKGEISCLTTHYYVGGPPENPAMTIDYLMHPGERLQTEVYVAMDAAKQAGLPFRMAEGNSCYNGGKPGMSDTMGSALWAGDFMLDLATRGAVGVNLHGGGMGVYTPIATDKMGDSTAKPDYFGVWLATQFAGSKMVRTELKATGGPTPNVTAYAGTSAGGQMQVAIFNKTAQPMKIAVTGMNGRGNGKVFLLTAPSIASTEGVTFGKGERRPGKVWKLDNNSAFHNGKVSVPSGSAVLLHMS